MRNIQRVTQTPPAWRMTKIRTAILDILSAASQPLSAKEIGEELSRNRRPVNKTTVYRDLALFLRQRLVIELGLGDDQKRYELTSKGHHHHLICKQCERVEDVMLGRELKSEEERIMRKTNFKIMQHSLEFYGICGSCQTKS